MAVVPISDMAIRLDTARYAYREVLEIYDLKIKDLIPDTPSDTFRLITSHLKEKKTHQGHPNPISHMHKTPARLFLFRAHLTAARRTWSSAPLTLSGSHTAARHTCSRVHVRCDLDLKPPAAARRQGEGTD